MAEADAELVERIVRWCAEAGRQAAVAEIRRALAPLGWDDLLALRALLADPPPARPLGPFALADVARGAPPEAAAEREREGRYRPEGEEDVSAEPPPSGPARAPPRPRAGRGRKPKAAAILIRRARDRAPAPEAAPPALPRLDDLRRPEGRAVLERLIRTHGGRRAALTDALSRGWRRDDGAAPGDGDLSALLDQHGLARSYARRERDEILHALRAAGGFRAAAAGRLGLDAAALDAAISRLGGAADAERIRAERRAELRARATLSERARLLLAEEERLRDLGVLGEIEADLAARLPEHVRALRAGAAPLVEAFGKSLSLDREAAGRLARRFALDLREAPGGSSPRARPPRTAPARSPARRGRGAPARPGRRPPARPRRGR